MAELLLASEFRTKYASLCQNLPPALLLTGADGVGLKHLAGALSPRVEEILEPLDSKGEVDSINGTISIEAIRQLYEQTRSRGREPAQIIIADADRMTKSAQQAFLKLLEEPPRGISFILTSHHADNLLPTIRSRVQKVIVPPISHTDSAQFITRAKLDDEAKKQILFAASGRPGLLTRLVKNPRERETLVSLVRDARDFIVGRDTIRLSVAFRYSDRKQALDLLDAALMLSEFSLTKHAEAAEMTHVTRLLDSHRNISAGGNVRLNLLKAMV